MVPAMLGCTAQPVSKTVLCGTVIVYSTVYPHNKLSQYGVHCVNGNRAIHDQRKPSLSTGRSIFAYYAVPYSWGVIAVIIDEFY